MTTATPAREPGILERLRASELESVWKWLEPGAKVLDVGGGTGYQARLLADRGCCVSSVDIQGPETAPPVYFPVQCYDGAHFPFPDASFDVVFSSNVLEHIRDLPGILAEMRRVCKPGGLFIHLMPTPAWRIWTQITYYPYLLRRLTGARIEATNEAEGASAAPRGGWAQLVRRLLVGTPHGEYPSAFSEIYYFSRRRWRRVFAENGFGFVAVGPNGLFYTGGATFPGLRMETRRKLARLLGSACTVYVMKARS